MLSGCCAAYKISVVLSHSIMYFKFKFCVTACLTALMVSPGWVNDSLISGADCTNVTLFAPLEWDFIECCQPTILVMGTEK